VAAEGQAAQVRRFPEPSEPDLLAVIVPSGVEPVTPEAMRLMQTMQGRHTDRRPVRDEPVPAEALDAVTASVAGLARLHVLTSDQVLEVAAAAARADAVEADDPQVREELAYWTGRAGPDGTGLPPEVLPAEAPRTTVPGRDFGTPGMLPIGPGHDRAAVYAILYGDDDEPESWLRAGEALSVVWLTATDRGVSLVPLSGAIEVSQTREALRHILADLGYPYLVLRLGLADPDTAGPPHTPRMPATQVVDTSAVRHIEAEPPGSGPSWAT
jgi:hypothetical protein